MHEFLLISTITFYVLLWIVSGIASLIYDWTRYLDFKIEDVAHHIIFGAILGPLWFVFLIAAPAIGKLMLKPFSRVNAHTVLIKRRNRL